jgi:hypothetical protein
MFTTERTKKARAEKDRPTPGERHSISDACSLCGCYFNFNAGAPYHAYDCANYSGASDCYLHSGIDCD